MVLIHTYSSQTQIYKGVNMDLGQLHLKHFISTPEKGNNDKCFKRTISLASYTPRPPLQRGTCYLNHIIINILTPLFNVAV